MDEPLSVAFEQACNGEFRGNPLSRPHCPGLLLSFWGLFQFDDYKSAIDAIIFSRRKRGFRPKFVNPKLEKKRGAG